MRKLMYTVAAVALISAPAAAGEMHQSEASIDTETRTYVVTESPSLDRLQAFEVMDLDNNYIVNDIEYKFAQGTYAGVQGYSFEELDLNGNGIITRDEASAEPYGDFDQEAEVALIRTEYRIESSLDLND